jgi:hypothetical protein
VAVLDRRRDHDQQPQDPIGSGLRPRIEGAVPDEHGKGEPEHPGQRRDE